MTAPVLPLTRPRPDPPDQGGPADPRAAADAYRARLRALEELRVAAEHAAAEARARRDATARAHRAMAKELRGRVEEVWKVVSVPLSRHGLDDLDQLRPAGPPPPPDVAEGPREAHDHCLRALQVAAELRGSGGGASTAATAWMTALGGLLAFGVILLLHGYDVVAAIPSLAIGGALAAAPVEMATDGGRRDVLRAALVGVGTAGLAVLLTAGRAHADPAGIALAFVAIAAALRFGLRVGSRS